MKIHIFFVLLYIILPSSSYTQSLTYHLENAARIAENEDEIDSVFWHLDAARALGLENDQLDAYLTNFLNFAQSSLYKYGYYEEGIVLLHRLHKDLTDRRGDEYVEQMDIFYQVARGYYFLKRNDESIEVINKNLKALERDDDQSQILKLADHYNLLAANYVAEGQQLKAINLYERVLEIRKKWLEPKHNLVASVINNLGVAYQDFGLYNKSILYYIQALKIREEILDKNHPNIATVLLNIGNLYDDKGEYNHAIRYYNRALLIFEENREQFEIRIADLFTNLAATYKNKGSFQESNAYHQQAILEYQSLPGNHSVEIGNVYINWSNLAALQKDHAKEVELAEQAIVLYKQTLEPNHPRLVAAHNNLGIAYANNGDYEGALAELLSLVPLIENDKERREQFANLNNDIGDIYYKIGKYTEAKSYNLLALNTQQELFGYKSYKLAYTYNNLAKITEAEGKRDEALQYLQQALAANHADFEAAYVNAAPAPRGFYKFDYFMESLMHKARLMRADGDASALLQANLLYLVADSVIAQVRDELLAKEDKIRLAETTFALSQAAIENYVQLTEITGDSRYLEEAFWFSEKSKNNVLAQSIQANQAKQFAGIPDSLVVLEDQLQSDINFFNLKLAEQPDSLERILFQNELFAVQQAYRTLVENLEADYPFYYQLKYDRTLPRVHALQFSLPEKTAMLSYFTGDSILYCFVITQNDFQVHRSLIGKEFYDQQVGLRKTIIEKLNGDYVALAHQLYQTLFPFELARDIESLIIIPDGTLSKLPFETLLSRRMNPRGNINFSKLPYLVNDYQINYELSATMYYQEQATMSTLDAIGEGLLAYAPVFAEPQEMAFYTSQLRDPIADLEADAQRTITVDGRTVNALPATASEVRAIAKVFQDKGQKVTTYLFKDASENKLKRSDLSQSKYIHIATHGFINEDQPDLSGLLLFPDTTGREDHILYSGEVYNLNLQAELVVLSACETGLGKVASGEGLLGLSRAFRYAGADNLVVSLWKVQDRATADLMTDFYKNHLDEGQGNFANPLRQAKLKMINSSQFSHPYYWSAFVLIGQ